ncbi:lipid A biosynthesis lauroyltransferase [Thiosulfatimonas sediminis]|uniref:Lipid A biosynthesis lauroyltransferase n=1 Tax=Thiosulfatimonas sediminis TaxID=2675054 RepID=A0A6F8PX05_9GAMM|nr:lysophospholipid acyltransferase family protein [Thiosulfatimonas sediminis]BBP46626.1 lipid A biosynthesis lauroyltransferase [Thiosulfatimonas sediminis]
MAKQSNPSTHLSGKHFWHPKYWGIWLGVGLLRVFSWLPFAAKFRVGKQLGRAMYWLAPKRRKIAAANLEIAFPEKSVGERQQLLKKHFESIGMGFAEMALIWHGDHKHHHGKAFERTLVTYRGEQNLQNALNANQGVLILAPHFTTLEVTGLFISFLTNYHAVYRPHDNPFMDYLIAKGRSIRFDNGEQVQPVANNNTRLMLKMLKSGGAMTFLPDQKYRAKGSVMVPLFGKEAPSNPATTKISKLTGCAVVPTFTRRIESEQGIRYEVEFLPALEHFPTEDDQDTLRLHHLYETAIRQAPEQYLWVHNRWNLKF